MLEQRDEPQKSKVNTDELPHLAPSPEQIPGLQELKARCEIMLASPDQLRAIACAQVECIARHEATIAARRDAEQKLLDTIGGLRREQARLEGELLAIRRARGQVPRTVADLLMWRDTRGATQAEAAARLGVGRATIERAEQQEMDTPLGPALRRAFEKDAMSLRTA
jgi:DNA-binding XRE family transcriptional regulator